MQIFSLIIAEGDRLVWADKAAQKQLGLPEHGKKAYLQEVFGSDSLYRRLTRESFNYRWNGILSAKTALGDRLLTGWAHWVTDELCVFNQICLHGILATSEEKFAGIPVKYGLDRPALESEQLRKVYEISSSINSNLDFQSICTDITRKAAELVGADRSLLYNVTDAGIGVFSAWNMTDSQRDLFGLVDFQHGIIKNCLRHRAPVLVPAYSLHPDWIPEIYESLCFESFILYPLYADQRLVGVLALFGLESLRFGDRHLMLLQMISNQMAIAVLNAQTYSTMQGVTKNLERELGLTASQLRVSELALIRKSNELSAVFDAITDALFVVDRHFIIREVNQAGLGFAGKIGQSELLGLSYCEVVGRRYNCGQCYLQKTMDSGEPQSVEIDVEAHTFTVTVYPVFDEHGMAGQAVCSLRDITIVRRKGAELIQSQKMQAVGTLAAGVAHEIRNPLGAISNYVYILESQLDEKISTWRAEESREALHAIRRLVERSENVIRNLLDFSRDKAPSITTFYVRDLIGQILLLVGKTAQKKKVAINVRGAETLQISSDSGAMQHILFNLVLNGIDAISEGGAVDIFYQKNEEGFLIMVEDNGTGIPPEFTDKIFNPFFTTKGPDRGTGLGLYLVYNEVKRLGGTIRTESSSGGPTRFTVSFPAEEKGR